MKWLTWNRATEAVGVFLLLLLLSILTYQYVVFRQGPLSGQYDVFHYYGPTAYFLDVCLHQGILPFWNPLDYLGVPTAGNSQSFMFYPFNLLRSLLTFSPTPDRTHVGLVIMLGLHSLVMGLGVYYLGRAHRLRPVAALTAALALLFSALVVRRMSEYHFIYTLAWLPWILLLEQRALEARELRRQAFFALAAGGLFGLALLGGFLQIANLMGLSVGVYGLLHYLLHAAPEWPGWSWRARLRSLSGAGGVLLAIVLVGGLIATVLIVSGAELSTFTLRQKGMTTSKYSNVWAWTLKEFYQKLVVFPGMKYEVETIRNSGVAGLLLALAGLTFRGRREVILWVGLLLVFAECCFGPPLPLGAFVEWLTPFSLSAYSRAWDFALFPLSLLAGMGVQALLEPLRRPHHAVLRAVLLAVAGLCLLVPLGSWYHQGFIKPGPAAVILPAVALGVMLLVGLLPLGRRGPAAVLGEPDGSWRPGRVALLLTALLPLLLFAETWSWNRLYAKHLARSQVTDPVPIRPEARSFPQDNSRDADPICNRYLYSMRASMNGVDPLHLAPVRDLLSAPPRDKKQFRGVQDWECTAENQRGNLLFKRKYWLARQAVRGPLPGKQELFPAATTAFVPPGTPELPVPVVEAAALPKRSIAEPQVRVLELPEPFLEPVELGRRATRELRLTLPRQLPGRAPGPAGAVHSALVVSYTTTGGALVKSQLRLVDGDRFSAAKSQRLDPTPLDQPATFELPLPDYPDATLQFQLEPAAKGGQGTFRFHRVELHSDRRDEDGLIRIRELSANWAEVELVDLPGPRLLVALDARFPGWRATLDGNPVEILTVHEQFKGVAVPAGTHRVRFELVSTVPYVGLAISLLAALATLVGLVLLGRGRGRRGEELGTRNEERATSDQEPATRNQQPETRGEEQGARNEELATRNQQLEA